MEIRIKGIEHEPSGGFVEKTTAKLKKLERFLPGQSLASLELTQEAGSHKKGDIWKAVLQIEENSAMRYRAESTKAKLDHAVTTVLRDVADELARAHKKAKDEKRKGSGILKDLIRGFRG